MTQKRKDEKIKKEELNEQMLSALHSPRLCVFAALR